jgi:acyl-CoA dehydrogenase family protein 9
MAVSSTPTPQHKPAVSSAGPHLAAPDINPSFIKGLFLGELREDLVFPYPELTSDEAESLRAVLDAFRAFASEHVDAARHDHEGKFDDAARTGMHELGLMGVNIPEAYGGFGASAQVFNRVFAEVGARDPALGVYFGAHQSIGCKGITLFGTEAQKQRWLPGCASGETIAAFCLTEPGSGSDANAMATTAIPSADGQHYVLDGTKIWISNAGYASVFTVFGKVPVVQPDGTTKMRTTAFIVDAHADGITLGQPEQKMGIKASDTRTVTFERVRVPAEDRLGEVGQGFKIALEILNSGRLGLASGSARGARRMMDEALAYAQQREQFGRPIGSFEMVQKKFATIGAEVYALDSAVAMTAGMVDRGHIDFSLETASCKIFGSELAVRASGEAMQIAGGIGYSKEYPYEQAMRDARINMIFEGTNEILRALIALSGLQQPGEQLKALGKAFKDPLHSLGTIGSYLAGKVKAKLTAPKFERVHPALEKESERVATVVHELAEAVEGALMKHGAKILERQFVQERMADAAIDIYLCVAVLGRTTWEIQRAGSVEAAAEAMTCAKLFLNDAVRRARRNVQAIERNQDGRLKQVAERAMKTGELVVRSPWDI